MSKSNYECLSRRALIQLNKDFDIDNDDALINYLNDRIDNYEKERPSEKIIDAADKLTGSFKLSKHAVKETLIREGAKLVDCALNSISAASESATKVVSGSAEKIMKDLQ